MNIRRGFTLIEISIWFAIFAVLAIGSSMVFARMLQRSKVTAAADIVTTGINEARSNAITSRGGGDWQFSLDTAASEVVVSCLNCTISQQVRRYSYDDSVTITGMPEGNVFVFDGDLAYTDATMDPDDILTITQVLTLSAGASEATVQLPPLGAANTEPAK